MTPSDPKRYGRCNKRWDVKPSWFGSSTAIVKACWKTAAAVTSQISPHFYKLHPLVDKLFMSAMAFCWSCPFPCSNPGSNKRGLTSVTRAYKSPPLQMESAAERGREVSGWGVGGGSEVWKMGKLLVGNHINARRWANKVAASEVEPSQARG